MVVNKQEKGKLSGKALVRRSTSGFTLLEVLLVLAILAFVGLAAFDMAGSGIRVQKALTSQEDGLMSSVRLWQWLERDMEQVVNRPVRDGLGESEEALTLSSAVLMLTRSGWQNPLKLKRSELQRVEYRLEDEQLVRVSWPVLDKDQETQPLTQHFAGVTEFKAELLASGSWQSDWPAEEQALLPGQTEAKVSMPTAIKITMNAKGLGEVYRIFPIPSFPFADPGN